MNALEQRAAGAQALPALSASYSDMRNGAVQYTGRPLDIALTGPNVFLELSREGKTIYGRQGAMHTDDQGRLVTAQGDLVMGLGGEIRVLSTSPRIDHLGNVYDQGRFVDKLSMASFKEPEKMTRLGGGVYDAESQRGAAAQDGAFSVLQGYLEGSNVDPAREMVGMIDVMRHFESLQKTAQFVDEMTGRAVQKLGEF
jgi:flagellar basal-body rod protein FlgG